MTDLTITQSYLLLSLFTSEGNIPQILKLASDYDLNSLYYPILLGLLPELTTAKEIKILITQPKASIELDLSKYLDIFEVDEASLAVRFEELKVFLKRIKKEYGCEDDLVSFIKARIRKTYKVIPNLQFYEPLIGLVSNDEGFVCWFDLELSSLELYTQISQVKHTLIEWESFDPLNKLFKIFESSKTLDYRFVRFLKNLDQETILKFIESANVVDLDLFNKIILIFNDDTVDKDALWVKLSDFYYNYSNINSTTLKSILEVINSFKIEDKLAQLVESAIIIDFKQPLKVLRSITDDPYSQAGLLKDVLYQITTASSIEQILQLLKLQPSLFNTIPRASFENEIYQRIISLRLFQLLPSEFDNDELIEKFFWQQYNTSNSLSLRNGHLSIALKSLNYLIDTTKQLKLKQLLANLDELTHYKTGSLKPRDFLNEGTDTIQLILELNKITIEELSKLYQIINEISESLNKEPLEEYRFKLLSIQSNLAHNDFEYAYQLSKSLLNSQQVSETDWLTFYQVCKFILLDQDEVPIDILSKQLDLLTDLLVIVPKADAHIVIEQWNAIELEISLRDELEEGDTNENLGLDQRLKRALSSSANELLQNEKKPLANLLVHGLGWAIGATK